VGLRINTNVAALNAARTLRRTTLDLNTNLERLSSGLRINRAKDDAAGLAISENFRTIIRGSAVAQRNVQDGISLLQTAEGALTETTNMLQRMRELAVQAANGTQSNANRTSLQAEVTELIEQIDHIAQRTEFNQFLPLNVTQTITLQTGIRGGHTLDVDVTAADATTLGVNGVDISTQLGAVAGLATVDTALDNTNALRADFGAQHNRLEYTMQTLMIQEENSNASDSMLRDSDIARETISFTRNQILISSGTSVLAQANVIPQTALQLLGG
jgi:flagellin